MVLTWIVGVLAACGVIWLVWLLLDAVQMPLPAQDSVHVVFLRGEAATAQQTLRGCLRLRSRHGMQGMLLLVDDGLDAGAVPALKRLLREQEAVRLCSRKEAADYLLGERTAWRMN